MEYLDCSKAHVNLWMETRPFIPFLEQLIVHFNRQEMFNDAKVIGLIITRFKKFRISYVQLLRIKRLVNDLYGRYAHIFSIPKVKGEPEEEDDVVYDSDATIGLEY